MNNPEFQFQTDIKWIGSGQSLHWTESNGGFNRSLRLFILWRLFYGYLNVPGSLDVLAVVSPVPGAAEPLGPEFTLEDARHLDAILGLEHVAAVRDEVLHYTQARIPVLSAGEILEDEERLLC